MALERDRTLTAARDAVKTLRRGWYHRIQGGSRKGDGKDKDKSDTGAGCFNCGHLKSTQSDDGDDLKPVLRRGLNGTTTMVRRYYDEQWAQ